MERPPWLVPVGILLLVGFFGLAVYMLGAAEKQEDAEARKVLERCIKDGTFTSNKCYSATNVLDSRDPLAVAFEEGRFKARMAEVEEANRKTLEQREATKKAKEIQLAAAKKLAQAGWREQLSGIYVRWCTKTCSQADVIGDSTFALMEVWCKERACGDIYAQVNFVKNGTTVGWTNDTLYLGYGQKGVLTFQKYGYEGGGSVQLVKFTARG